jgi:flagellin
MATKGLAVGAENLQAAESVIRDTNMAEQMVSFTKNNILTQASTAMLSQANAKSQGVLQLLQG